MNANHRRRLKAAFLLAVFVAFSSAVCLAQVVGCAAVRAGGRVSPGFDVRSIRTYRDIPGITEMDIKAIEALKSQRELFTYGCEANTEAFLLPDGSIAGFAALFCDFLSGLFGVPFVLDLYGRDEMPSLSDNNLLDFTGVPAPAPTSAQAYFTSYPIAGRTLAVFFNDQKVEIGSEQDLNGLTIGFHKNAMTGQNVKDFYPGLQFEPLEYADASEAAGLLESGKIDAFIAEATEKLYYNQYPFITGVDVLPLIHTPVSMATANPALSPVISVVNKYLEAGGVSYLYELYLKGRHEFSKYQLALSFTGEEMAYIADLAARGAKVAVALQHDNYPICYYDEGREDFCGIVPDILAEISALTGIGFEAVTGKDTTFAEMLDMLRAGDAGMISQLLRTNEREDSFLWAEKPYHTSYFAFLSRIDYPDLELFQISQSKVGLVEGTAHAELYRDWFPNDTGYLLYNTAGQALDALELGEIDLFLSSGYTILYQANFREKAGFKINATINTTPLESFFGFSRSGRILRDVIDKAQKDVNTERIAQSWANRTYGNARRLAEQRALLLAVFVPVLALMLVFALFLYMKSRKAGNIYKERAVLTERQNSLLMAENAEMARAKEEAEQSGLCGSEPPAKTSPEMITPAEAGGAVAGAADAADAAGAADTAGGAAETAGGAAEDHSRSEKEEVPERFVAPDVKVLIVDDISANLVVARGLLRPYKMQVDLCKSGGDAIEAVKPARYDIVFMDHRMPGVDGVEAVKIIREMGAEDPQYSSLPIVALTTDAASGTVEMFLKNGFNDFLLKPIDTVKLHAILEKWLPGEKRKSPASVETSPVRTGLRSKTVEGGGSGDGIRIPGVDVANGIAASGGSPPLYMDTLAAFYKDGRERAVLLGKCLETGDLNLYRIYVHGLKSALLNIGAETLSAAAKALEEAARSVDMRYIHSNNAAFISDLDSLLDHISGCLSARSGSVTGMGGPVDM